MSTTHPLLFYQSVCYRLVIFLFSVLQFNLKKCNCKNVCNFIVLAGGSVSQTSTLDSVDKMGTAYGIIWRTDKFRYLSVNEIPFYLPTLCIRFHVKKNETVTLQGNTQCRVGNVYKYNNAHRLAFHHVFYTETTKFS